MFPILFQYCKQSVSNYHLIDLYSYHHKRVREEKYGAFTIALVFIGYFNLFDLGLGRAITKLISERIGKDKDKEIGDIFKTGVSLTFLLGIVGGLIFYLIAEPITINFLKPPEDF